MEAARNLEPDRRERSPGTLGDVLYANRSKAPVSETEWVALVQAVAAGNQPALHALYERAHRPVFTLIVRITANRETAEELTLDVFHDVWRRAARYDPAGGTVLGWIMNQARSRAIDRLRFDRRKKRVQPEAGGSAGRDRGCRSRQSCRIQAAEPGTAARPCRPHTRGATYDRGGVFLRIDACRSRGAAERASRNRQDANPLRTAQASAGAGRGSERAMNSGTERNPCHQSAQVCAYAMQALPASEVVAIEAHISSCSQCRQELEALRPIVDSFVAWPTDVLRPSASLQGRLARRIAAETGGDPVLPPARQWTEPEWEEVAPGIFCKLLATDTAKHRVSMLVRLLPGVAYPPHAHAEFEELHLLDGELWIDDRKLHPGDYNRAEAPTGDQRVWSETGCTCVLITSTLDVLR